MSSSAGQKVTTDPETFNNPKNENPGVVPKDSLAGESIKEGGSFGANSDARGPLDQPAHSITANTTDTSNATKLDAAPDASHRAGEPLNSASASGKESGVGPTYNATAGSVSTSTNAATAGQAPGYAAHPAPSMGDNFAPKGKNIQEGGFDSSAPNASFNADVGGKNDPGRAALGGFQEENVPVAGVAGARQQDIDGDTPFNKLGGDASA